MPAKPATKRAVKAINAARKAAAPRKPAPQRVDPVVLTAALANPEDGVTAVRAYKPGTYAAAINDLAVGHAWAHMQPLPTSCTLAELPNVSNAMRAALRNRVQGHVTRVKGDTAKEFTCDTGDFITAERKLFVACVVTRTA